MTEYKVYKLYLSHLFISFASGPILQNNVGAILTVSKSSKSFHSKDFTPVFFIRLWTLRGVLKTFDLMIINLHFIFREMEAKGGLTYESADRTVQQLSHEALPPPLSLQQLKDEDQLDK